MRQKLILGKEIDAATKEEVAELLRDFARSGHVAFGGERIEKTLENWPVMGHKRQVRVSNLNGGNNIIIPDSVYTDVLQANNGRGGLSLINIGDNPCSVFLTPATIAEDLDGAVAAGWLFASNGEWDGRIGRAEWTGPVSVFCNGGTTLVVAEV